MERKPKSVLIINESANAKVTLNLFVTWDVVCWLPYISKTIRPNTKFLHSSDKDCKFELVARSKDKRSGKIILKPQQLIEDRVIRVTDSLCSLEIEVDNLAKYKRKKNAFEQCKEKKK